MDEILEEDQAESPELSEGEEGPEEEEGFPEDDDDEWVPKERRSRIEEEEE